MIMKLTSSPQRLIIYVVAYCIVCTVVSAFLTSPHGVAALERAGLLGGEREQKKRLIVLVTGASTGIGKATSLMLAKENDRFIVYATMRAISDWEDVPALENLHILPLDVTSDLSVNGVINAIKENEKRGVDVLINNAGIGVAGCLELVDIQQAKDMFEVNVWGPVRMMQAVLPSMRSRGYGYIINLSSTSGIRGVPCFEYYVGSKFALEGISDSLRYSVAPFNISVTNVHASIVKTSFSSKIKQSRGSRKPSADPEDYKYLSSLTDRFVSSMEKRVGMADTQKVEEVAQVLVNLVHIKLQAKKISDVPFNIGSNMAAQKIIETVRKDPIGWGEISKNLLLNMPPVPERRINSPRSDL